MSPAVSAAPKASAAPEEKTGGIPSIVVQALTAIGAGVGVLGFVVFFGGAILWVRYDKIGLPANDAIAIVPKPVLLTTGASFLVPALLVSLAVVLALVILGLLFRTRIAYLDYRETGDPTKDRAQVDSLRVEAEQWLAAAQRFDQVLAEMAKQEVEGAEPPEPTQLERDREAALSKAAEAETQAFAIEKRVPKAQEPVLITRLDELGQKTRTTATLVFVGAVVVAELWLVADGAFSIAFQFSLPPVEISLASVGLFLLALGTAGASWLVYKRTTNLAWMAVAMFLSIGIFDGASSYARTVNRLKVQPAAVLLKGQGPITGFFVAETSTRLYLGVGDLKSGHTRLAAIPTDNVAAYEVGDLLSAAPATSAAASLGLELCVRRDQEKLGDTAADQAQAHACTPRQEQRLRVRQRLRR